jgi:hypothetical protein
LKSLKQENDSIKQQLETNNLNVKATIPSAPQTTNSNRPVNNSYRRNINGNNKRMHVASSTEESADDMIHQQLKSRSDKQEQALDTLTNTIYDIQSQMTNFFNHFATPTFTNNVQIEGDNLNDYDMDSVDIVN